MRNILILILSFSTFCIHAQKTNTNNRTISEQSLKDLVVDIDGNVYHTVKIGTQVWMVENLKVTHYSNGDAIPNITDSIQWSNLTTGGYCNYLNDTNIAKTYGKLYNWYAVNDKRSIAPKGWHVPSDAEWTTLVAYCGGDSLSNKNLKEPGKNNWQEADSMATNQFGFTALPGGYRNTDGSFGDIKNNAYWWSTPEANETEAWFRDFNSKNTFRFLDKSNLTMGMTRYHYSKVYGFSVRCLKDY